MTFPQNQRLISLFARSPVQQTLGTRLDYDAQGRARVEYRTNEAFDNALGATHGGILSTLLDTAGWFAVAPAYDTWIVTVDLHVHLLDPADGGLLTAVGASVRTGSKLALARMEVTREDGVVVARGEGTFSVTRVKLA